MGLNTIINNAVEVAFDVVGKSTEDGLQTLVTYIRVTSKGTYDPATGKSTPTEVTSTFEAIRYQNRDRELDGNKIDVNEARLVFPSTRIDFNPTKDDRIEIGTEKFHILNVYQPPGGSIWTIEMRGT